MEQVKANNFNTGLVKFCLQAFSNISHPGLTLQEQVRVTTLGFDKSPSEDVVRDHLFLIICFNTDANIVKGVTPRELSG